MKTFLIVLAIVIVMVVLIVFLLRALHQKHLKEIEAFEKAELERQLAEVEARKAKEAAEKALEPECIKEAEEAAKSCSIEHPAEEEPCKHNCYFFNIHNYISAKGKSMFCVLCKASIKGGTWLTIKVKNSYYPNLTSYTEKLANKIMADFVPDMSLEEFKSKGSFNMEGVGELVKPLCD